MPRGEGRLVVPLFPIPAKNMQPPGKLATPQGGDYPNGGANYLMWGPGYR